MLENVLVFLKRYKVYIIWFLYFTIATLFVFCLRQKNTYSLKSIPPNFKYGILELSKLDQSELSTYSNSLHNLIVSDKKILLINAQNALWWNVVYIILLPFFIFLIYSIFKSKKSISVYSTNDNIKNNNNSLFNRIHNFVIKTIHYKHLLLIIAIILLHIIEHLHFQYFVCGRFDFCLMPYISVLSTTIYMLYAILILSNIRLINSGFKFIAHLFYYNTPILIFLLLLYLVFTFNQGQNILLILTENDIYTGLFFLIINLTAFWQWQLSKILQNGFQSIKTSLNLETNDSKIDHSITIQKEQKSYTDNRFRRSIPRLLAVMVYLIPFYGFHKILHDSNISYWGIGIDASLMFIIPFLLLFVFFNTETISLRVKISPHDWSKLWYAILLVLFILMLLLLYCAQNEPTIYGLDYRATSLFLQMLFFIVFVIGRKYNRFTKYGVINSVIFFSVIILCLFTIVSVFWLLYSQHSFVKYSLIKYNILILIIGLFLFWEFIVVFLLLYGRIKKISFITFIIVPLGILIFFHNDSNYQLPDKSPKYNYENLPVDTTYIKRWLNEHYNNLISTDSSIYIINGYGGGIRASAFFYYTISSLNNSFKQKFNNLNVNFIDNVLSFSTASGSSLGSVKLVSDWVNYGGKLMDSATMTHFYKQDFLSSVFVSHVSSEFFMKFFSANYLRDRLQERNWTILDSNLSSSYYSLYHNNSKTVPLLLFNTTEGRSGKSALLAPLRLSEFYFAGKLSVSKQILPCNISLADAALITARFPLLSPGLATDKNEVYFDGGLSENSGCATNLMLLKQLEYILSNTDTLYKYLKIKVISIHNTPRDINSQYDVISQPVALLNAFMNIGVNGSSQSAEELLKAYCKKNNYLFYSYYVNNTSKIILPLGWVLSDSASYRLYQSAQSLKRPF